MNRDNERQSAIILSVIGIIPVVWLALLIAPSVKGGLPEILPSLLTAFNNPFHKYFWNQAPNSRRLKEKADYIKSKGKWALVREQYKRIKNKYLTSNDYNHSSFICYIEAVNNVYNSRKHWD